MELEFWYINKYDEKGNYVGRLVVEAVNKGEAKKKMLRIALKWTDGLHLGDNMRGPYATRLRAETVLH